ncbi:MAG: hypothetical protein ABIP64_06315 [Burkholderiales bacterium]
MLQALIVYAIVTSAALYAAWRWTPISTRANIVSHVVLFAKRHGLSKDQAERWQARASEKVGCGSCGPCKACKTDTAKTPDHIAS